jgi:hexosaminidase
VNSDDRVYIVTKYSSSYPQQLNQTFIFEGNPEGGAWSPYIFDSTNSSNNPTRDNPYVLGHIAPQWNDYGANASTYLEAYYSWRDGLPALADKQWGGKLSRKQYNTVFEVLQASAPAQNLDRKIKSASSTILKYDFNSSLSSTKGTIRDLSGNTYDATTNCTITNSSALSIRPGCFLTTPLLLRQTLLSRPWPHLQRKRQRLAILQREPRSRQWRLCVRAELLASDRRVDAG